MRAYAVGQPYVPGRTRWPQTPHLTISDGVELAISINAPRPEEVEAVRTGRASFAWIAGEHLGVLAFRFGGNGVGIPWSDCPYTPNLSEQAAPPGNARTGRAQTVIVVLIDAHTGLVAALRAVAWPPRFVDAVAATVARMATMGSNLRAHDAALANLYERYPTTAKLVRDRADVICTGGQVQDGQGPDAFVPERGR